MFEVFSLVFSCNLEPSFFASFYRAQKYYHENLSAMFVGKLCGLLAVLAVPSILKILIYSKQSSEPVTAYRRYMQTVFHVISWYKNDLKPGSKLVNFSI